MTFANPLYLLLLLLPLGMLLWHLFLSRTREPQLLVGSVEEFLPRVRTWRTRLANLPTYLLIAAAALVVVCLARPQTSRNYSSRSVEGIDSMAPHVAEHNFLICYDAMFPEIHRYYATHGADAVLMPSASAEKSEYAMRTVVPARCFENTVYTLFCNNTGTGPAGRYYGGSCVFSPLGKPLVSAGTGSEVVTATLSAAEIESARKVRTHLADLRSDIDWN